MLDAVVVVDNVISNVQAIFPIRLCCKNPACLVDRFAVACQQTLDLRVLFAIHDKYTIYKLQQGRSEEEGNDDELVAPSGKVSLAPCLSADPRMENSLESLAIIFVGEHDLAHGGTIEIAGGIDHALAEARLNLVKCRLPRRDDLAGDNVGIDNRSAEVGEQVSDKGLAAGDTAGQADTQWDLSGRSSHSEHYV